MVGLSRSPIRETDRLDLEAVCRSAKTYLSLTLVPSPPPSPRSEWREREEHRDTRRRDLREHHLPYPES